MQSSARLGKAANWLLVALTVTGPAWRTVAGNSAEWSMARLWPGGVLTLSAAPLPAQIWNRDPLTDAEADQLREAAEEPDKRMTLLMDFATARMAKVDEAGTSKPAATRGRRLHDALDEFGRVMDEVDDNIDDYQTRRMDMRKGLAHVIETDTQFQSKLTELHSKAESSSAGADGDEDYQFVLEDDLDLVNSQIQHAKEALEEQERMIQQEKARQKQASQ